MLGNEEAILDLNKKISERRCAFICGNGFSINFDKEFSNIYGNLYSAHKDLIYNSQLRVKSNKAFSKKCNENYKSVLQHLRYFSEEKLMTIFEDAVLFAESIKANNELIDEFWERGIISKLTFGFSELEPLEQICKVSREKGIRYVNIEHWTILIYFYAAIKNMKPSYYHIPNNNSFITVLKHGDKNNTRLIHVDNEKAVLQEDVIFNGFTTYFKMLFSIAIFSKGKAVKLNKLDNLDNLDTEKLKQFLNRFNVLISLNYDKIMELIVDKNVEHLHGEFILNKEEYVYNQSYGLNFDEGYVSFSDILIGDYFIFKSFLPIVNSQSATKSFFNKKTLKISDRVTKLIKDNSISTVLIFGMNVENDYHLLRNLMLTFYDSGVTNPNIIYSYFNEKEKQEFSTELENVITFNKEVSEYCRNINVSYVQTQQILASHFYKNAKTELV
ncbi:hypothetical protein [Aquibacillus sediminis]|uniref:hypothetical protein n=1 Tax=Aquibacillus sediminis TaxID=2574734 RepID=UPI0011081AA9|nr:hypothetical protein [Aquibacillus sediminis]